MKGAELIAVKVKQFLLSLGSSFSGRENLACWRCMGEGGGANHSMWTQQVLRQDLWEKWVQAPVKEPCNKS